jgi:hypothetical protein
MILSSKQARAAVFHLQIEVSFLNLGYLIFCQNSGQFFNVGEVFTFGNLLVLV